MTKSVSSNEAIHAIKKKTLFSEKRFGAFIRADALYGL